MGGIIGATTPGVKGLRIKVGSRGKNNAPCKTACSVGRRVMGVSVGIAVAKSGKVGTAVKTTNGSGKPLGLIPTHP
jgi:hypothetical protein